MNFCFSESRKTCDTSHGFAWGPAGGQGPPESLKQFLRSDSLFCWFYGACMNFSFSRSMKKCDTSHGFAGGVAGWQGPPQSLNRYFNGQTALFLAQILEVRLLFLLVLRIMHEFRFF